MQQRLPLPVPAVRWPPKAGVRGFSLAEMMIVIAVIGVLAAIAFPSFTSVVNGGRLSGMTNELVASIQIARTEAIRRNVRAVVCPSANGTSCSGGSNWSAGWMVFFDNDRNDAPGGVGDTVLRYVQGNAPTQVLTSPAIGAALVFRPDGRARVAGTGAGSGALVRGTIAVCLPVTQPTNNIRDVTITFGSQVSLTRRNGGGACAAPADPAP